MGLGALAQPFFVVAPDGCQSDSPESAHFRKPAFLDIIFSHSFKITAIRGLPASTRREICI
jgi:hypothetical protein